MWSAAGCSPNRPWRRPASQVQTHWYRCGHTRPRWRISGYGADCMHIGPTWSSLVCKSLGLVEWVYLCINRTRPMNCIITLPLASPCLRRYCQLGQKRFESELNHKLSIFVSLRGKEEDEIGFVIEGWEVCDWDPGSHHPHFTCNWGEKCVWLRSEISSMYFFFVINCKPMDSSRRP